MTIILTLAFSTFILGFYVGKISELVKLSKEFTFIKK